MFDILKDKFMKNLKILLAPSILIIVTLIFVSALSYEHNFTSINVQTDSDTTIWVAPDSVNSMINPIEIDEEIMEESQMLYKKHCRSCHGRLGDGKGTGAADISTVPTDFNNPEFLKQSDGSMFWKISEGKDDMAGYSEKLSEEEIWLTVIYIKTFSQTEKEE